MSAHSRPTEILSLEIEPADYRFLRYVEGEHCACRVATLVRIGRPSTRRATQLAMAQAPEANFLLNRHIMEEEQWIVPIVFHRLCVSVEGAAVVLFDAAARR